MSVVVLGKNGQLGKALQSVLPDAIFLGRENCDMVVFDEIYKTISSIDNVTHIINAAAYTNVDNAEIDEYNADIINAKAVGCLSITADQVGAKLIQISTDYVFDGKADTPYGVDAKTNPMSVYGKTKLDGEKNTAQTKKYNIVRTSWLYGDGNNFVKTMFGLGQARDSVSVVDDQFGIPTYTKDLAIYCKHLTETDEPNGIYHFSSRGEPISWARLAESIFIIKSIDCRVDRITTEEFNKMRGGVIAPRPKYSALELDPNLYIRSWPLCLNDYLMTPAFRI